jgi:hypothetical protein
MVYFLEEDIKKNDKKEIVVKEPQVNFSPLKPSIKRSRLRENIQLHENAKEKSTKVVDLRVHEFVFQSLKMEIMTVMISDDDDNDVHDGGNGDDNVYDNVLVILDHNFRW